MSDDARPQPDPDEITEFPRLTPSAMHLNAELNGLSNYEILAGTMHAVAMYACLHAKKNAPDQFYTSLVEWFSDAVDHARLHVATQQSQKATKQ